MSTPSEHLLMAFAGFIVAQFPRRAVRSGTLIEIKGLYPLLRLAVSLAKLEKRLRVIRVKRERFLKAFDRLGHLRQSHERFA